MNESKLKSSVMVRMFITASLGLFLLLLAQWVGSLISEREHRRVEAIREVSEKWGGTQTVTGPILTLPFKKPVKNEKGETIFCIDYLHILPDKLQAEVVVNPEVRYRGAYEVILYQSLVRLKGTFVLPKIEKQGVPPENLLLKEAFVIVGITDPRGIKNAVTLDWDGAKLPANPGIKPPNVVKSGFTVFPAVDLSNNEYLFSADLHLNGCGEFNITPVGKETRVTLSSKWRSPSFTGGYLPEKREITSNGFRAEWNVQHLSRNFPQTWTGGASAMGDSAFGVRLYLPVDRYQKVTRTVKYAIMFIALTFMAFFLTEIFSAALIHPVQYALIGLAILLFYVILLSLSEHIFFAGAYAIASLGTIFLISAYAKSVLGTKRSAAIIGGVLAALYLFLFVTLQLEDYALLIGSIGLFAILAVVMYLTRRIDWFDIGRNGKEKKIPSFEKGESPLEIET